MLLNAICLIQFGKKNLLLTRNACRTIFKEHVSSVLTYICVWALLRGNGRSFFQESTTSFHWVDRGTGMYSPLGHVVHEYEEAVHKAGFKLFWVPNAKK